jgi:hypothetical protein
LTALRTRVSTEPEVEEYCSDQISLV